jgi:hypothetical protein
MLHLQMLSWPGGIKKTSGTTPTIAAVHIAWTQVVQGLRCEAVCFVFVATVVVVARVWRVWYQKMAC